MTIHYSPDNLPPMFELSPFDEEMCAAALRRLREARAKMWRGSIPHVASVLGETHPSTLKAVVLYATAEAV